MAISLVRDRYFDFNQSDWGLWRDVYDGGSAFINNYLQKFSTQEDDKDFKVRRDITYNANFASSNIDEIKNSIFCRMPEISRAGGSKAYQEAVKFQIDGAGHSMDSFIGTDILPELLVMGRVGIYVDRGVLPQYKTPTNRLSRPYIYAYQTEDIRSLRYNESGQLVVALLRDHVETFNDYGLVDGLSDRYRLLTLTDEGVKVQFIEEYVDADSGETKDRILDEVMLELKQIPFHCIQIKTSLMSFVARHQVALLNMSSSDIAYSLKSNFPFYVEQVDERSVAEMIRRTADELKSDADTAGVTPNRSAEKVKLGTKFGRRYGRNLDQPTFIHPSSEPLKASMLKQAEIKDEMRSLLHLAIKQLDPQVASAESKRYENLSLESGLSFIGLMLQDAERAVARIWAEYEKSEPATVEYPAEYDLQTDDERQDEIDSLKKNLTIVPSKEYGTAVLMRLAKHLVGRFVSKDTWDKISKEIKDRKILTGDIEYMRNLTDTNTLSPETQGMIANLPSGEYEKATEAHAERVKIINEAQMSDEDKQARGVEDLSTDPNAGKDEKAQSRDVTTKASTKEPVRGKGKTPDV